MIFRRLAVITALAASLFAAAGASAAPVLVPATLQCDGVTYLSGGNTHTPTPTVQVTVQDSTGLRIGQQPMGVTGLGETRELWKFDAGVTVSNACPSGNEVYTYVYNDPNTSDAMVVGQCVYSGCGGTVLLSTVQKPLGQTVCPASPPSVGAVSIFSGGQGGSFNTAATFDGSAVQFGSVTYNQTGLGDRPQTYTLSAWIKTSAAGPQTILSESEGHGGFWGFGTSGGGVELFDSRNTLGGTAVVKTGSTAVNNGLWHKIDVVRLDGQYERFYVDGLDIGEVLANSTWSFMNASSSSTIFIGAYLAPGTNMFNGQVDELRVIDAALTDDDIRMEYLGSNLHLYSAAAASPLTLVQPSLPSGFNPAISNGTIVSSFYFPGEAINSGTAPNQRYVFEAQNTASVSTVLSTFTVTINTNAPTSPQGLTGTPASINSITWSWTAPGFFCPPPGSASVYYQLYDATAGGAALNPPGNMPYTTTNQNITESIPGTPNLLRSRKLTLTDAWGTSPLSPSASAYTEAAAPSAMAAASVSTGGFVASWSVNGNPAYTRYEVTYTTDPNFVVGVTTREALASDFTASSVGFTGLQTGTTYYVRVRAFNGQASDTYGGVGTAFANGIFVTDAGPPTLSGTPLSNSSIRWSWTTVPGANGYTLYDTPTSAVLFGPDGAGVTFTSATLSVNTRYDAEVQGDYPAPTPPTGFGQAFTYTWANAPTATAVSAVHSTSATFTWSANGNPSYTFYEVVVSTDPGYSVVVATLNVTSPSLTITGLLPGVTYYSEVQAINGVQIPDAAGFVAIPPATTIPDSVITVSSSPATPYAVTANLVGAWQFDEDTGTVTADGTGGADVGIFACTTPVCASTPTWASGPPGMGSAASFSGIAGGVVASSQSAPFAFTGSLTVEAWVYPQTAAQLPGAGIVTRGPSGAEDFALEVTGSEAFSFLSSNGFSATVATATIVAGQWTHVVGVYDGVASKATLYINGVPRAVTTGVPARTNHASAPVAIGDWYSGSPSFFGRVDAVRVFNAALSASQVLADYTGGFISTVTAPAPNAGIMVGLAPNAFGAPAQIFISADPVHNPIRITPAALTAGLSVPPSGLTLVPNSLVEVVPVVGGIPFTTLLGSSATLTIPYNDPSNAGVISGTNPPLAVSGLAVYTLNTAVNAWVPLPTYVNKSARTVTGVTPHFSVFGLFAPQTIGTSLAGIRVYPVPWKPGTGGRFDAPGVTFANLPTSGTIRILTVAGVRVRDFNFSGANAGVAVWDGTNDGGRRTASGVYFARVTSGVDGSTTIVKFAVER
jgi:hypothetical protein